MIMLLESKLDSIHTDEKTEAGIKWNISLKPS